MLISASTIYANQHFAYIQLVSHDFSVQLDLRDHRGKFYNSTPSEWPFQVFKSGYYLGRLEGQAGIEEGAGFGPLSVFSVLFSACGIYFVLAYAIMPLVNAWHLP